MRLLSPILQIECCDVTLKVDSHEFRVLNQYEVCDFRSKRRPVVMKLEALACHPLQCGLEVIEPFRGSLLGFPNLPFILVQLLDFLQSLFFILFLPLLLPLSSEALQVLFPQFLSFKGLVFCLDFLTDPFVFQSFELWIVDD